MSCGARRGRGLLLFNGRDGEWQARLSLRGKKAAVAEVGERTREQAAEPDVWLCFAPVKRARIDYIAEKATELGVAVLQPVITRHTNVERVNVERLHANAVEAAEQTERLSVPEVRAPVDLMRLLADWPAERRLLMCDETGGGPPIGDALARTRRHGARAAPWAIVIGPEGGFAETELVGASSHEGCHGCRARSAHPARRHRGAGGAGLLAEHWSATGGSRRRDYRAIIAHRVAPFRALRAPLPIWDRGLRTS